MTHVAEPTVGAADRPGGTERVTHWINGAAVAGASGRSGPVYNPATGEVAREVDFASAARARDRGAVDPVLDPFQASRVAARCGRRLCDVRHDSPRYLVSHEDTPA